MFRIYQLKGKFIYTSLLTFAHLLLFSTLIFSLQKNESIKHLNSITLNSVLDVDSFIVLDDFIYSIEISNNRIFKHSISGELQANFGSEGRGPNEFSKTPSELTYNAQDKIAIIDNGNFAIRFYSKNLVPFESVIRLKLPASDIDFAESGKLLISYLPVSNKINSIQVYDDKLKLFSEFNPQIEADNFILNSFYINSLFDDLILVTYRFRNLFQIYNQSGKLLHSFSLRDLPAMSKTQNLNTDSPYGKNIPTDLIFYSPTIDDNNNILLIGAAYSKVPHKTLYKINLKGELLNESILNNECGQLSYHKNKLYALCFNDLNIIHVYNNEQ